MKNYWFIIKSYNYFLLGLLLILTGCQQMSEVETDTSAGLNGGFEVSKKGLPVNWLMYSPTTVPDADFEIELDKSIFKEGKQSLRFKVKKCSSTGGWISPGFTNEFFGIGKFEGEGVYKLSFWIKNNGTKYRVNAGGVAPLKGDMKVLVESAEEIEEWKYLEYKINIPKDRHLKMELNILEPGTFWIDDIQIEKI